MPAPDGRPGNGQKVWASAFTGIPDVAYNVVYLQAVANVAREHDLLVITDAIYEYIRYDGREHISISDDMFRLNRLLLHIEALDPDSA